MIERLSPGEGARLRAIRLRALADSPDAYASTLDDAKRISPERWETYIKELPTFIWREAEGDLGVVRGAPHDTEPEAAYLISMWVDPKSRGRGIGAALVRRVIAWAREQGFRRIVLDVSEPNISARALYLSCGFHETGNVGSLPPPREHIRELEMERASYAVSINALIP